MHVRKLLILAAAAAVGATLAPALEAQAPPPPPPVTVGGLVYAQYMYQDFPAAGGVRLNSFDIKRAYINLIGRFSGGVYGRITVDLYNPPNTPDSSRTIRLKYAYFAWTPAGSGFTFKGGEIHTAWLDWEEALWDYRVQGQMALERGGYASSSDFGAGIDYKLGADQVNGQFTIVNGEGYSRGTGDYRKDVQLRLSARVMATNDSSRVGGLRLTGFGQIGTITGGGDRNRYLGMLSYRTKQLTLAGEYAGTKDAAIKGSVISAYGVYKFTPSRFALLGRVDVTDPNTSVGNNKQTRIIGGVSYQVSPQLRLLADLDRVSFEAGTTAHSQALIQAQLNF